MKGQYKPIESRKEVPDQLRKLRSEKPYDHRVAHFKTLGEEYTPQALAWRIQQIHAMGLFKRMEIYNKRYPPLHPHYQKLRQDFRKAVMEASTAPTCVTATCWENSLPHRPTTARLIRPCGWITDAGRKLKSSCIFWIYIR